MKKSAFFPIWKYLKYVQMGQPLNSRQIASGCQIFEMCIRDSDRSGRECKDSGYADRYKSFTFRGRGWVWRKEMCIRDRSNDLRKWFHADVEKRWGAFADMYQKELKESDAAKAVSYTHLDVYKRQPMDCSVYRQPVPPCPLRSSKIRMKRKKRQSCLLYTSQWEVHDGCRCNPRPC